MSPTAIFNGVIPMGVIPMMGMVALMMLERYMQNLQSNRFNDQCLNFTNSNLCSFIDWRVKIVGQWVKRYLFDWVLPI